jgi:hypothetical protein
MFLVAPAFDGRATDLCYDGELSKELGAMLLPFREHLDFAPTAYDQLQAEEGIPILKGNAIEDVTTLELGRWERMGADGCYLNLSHQQQTDAYVFEIHPGTQTLPQRHLFEEIVYVAKGRGATSVWQEGSARVTFEWGRGAIFAIPLNASYIHFNGSRDERCGCSSAPLVRA